MSDSLREERMQFIVNPRAYGGRTGRIWTELTSQISKCDVKFIWYVCKKGQDAKKLIRRGIKQGATTIVIVGGDGTFHNAVNAIIEDDKLLYPDIKLAYWPTGNGMNFANSLGFPQPLYPIKRLFDETVLTKIDVGRAELTRIAQKKKNIKFYDEDDEDDDDFQEDTPLVRYFINSASCGLTAEIGGQVNKIPKLVGSKAMFSLAYYLSGKEYQNPHMQIVADGKEIAKGSMVLATADNGCFRNGSLEFAPQAALHDGLLDVVAIGDMDKNATKDILALAKKGEHINTQGVTYVKAKEIKMICDPPSIVELDGEIPGKTPATFSVLPQMLSFWAPIPFVKK